MHQCLEMLNGEGIRDCRCASVRPLATSGCTATVHQNQPSIIYPAYTRDSGFQEPSESLASQWQVAFCIYERIVKGYAELRDAQPILTENFEIQQNCNYHLLSRLLHRLCSPIYDSGYLLLS